MMTNTSKPVPANNTPTRTATRTRRRWSSVDPGALDTETRKHILLASSTDGTRSMTLEELFIVSPRGRRNLKRRNAMDLINHPAFEQQDEQDDYLTNKKFTRRMVASRSCSALLSEHHNYGSTYNRPNNSRNCSRDKASHPYDGQQQGARRISTPNSLTGNFYQDYHDKNKAYISCSRTRKVMLERTDELRYYEDSTSISSSSSTSSSNNNDKRRSFDHQLEPTDFVDTGYIPRNEDEENKYSKDKTNYSLTSWWGKMQKKRKQKDNNDNNSCYNDDRRMKMRSMKMTRSMKNMFSRSLQLLPNSTNDNDDYLEDDIIQTRIMILERSKSRNESNLHNYLSSY
jgi:hypothetical protein